MPDAKISDLPAGGDPQDTDEFVVARGATNVSLAWSSLSNAATRNNVALTLDGNTAGALALVSTGTLTLAGGNNITLSQAGNAVTISGAAAGGAQTAISGISASDTLYTSGTVRFTGSQAVTVRSSTGQLVIIDAPAQSVQPETQTFIGGISASDTLYTSGTVRFTGVGGGVTVSSNTGQRVDISVAAQSVQPETQTFLAGLGNSETTYTSGTVNLSVNGGALTIRSTTGQAFQFSVSQSVQPETQTFIGGIANSQTTYTSGTVSLSELGAITIRSTTGNQYQLSVNSQTVQTQGVLSAGVSTGGNTAGNTTVNTGSRFVIVGSNGITASQGTAAGATTVTLSGVTQSVQTNDIPRLGVSTGGNTAGDTTVNSGTRFVLVGSNMVSLSQATAASATTVTINATQTAQTQGIINAGVSTGGNTSGDTGVNSGTRLVFAGGNNITLSQGTAANATTVTISAGAGGGFSGGMSTNGNTSGDTGYASQRLNLVGGNNITLSGSTNAGSMSITISAPNLGAGAMSAGVSTGGNTAGATGITGTQLVLVGSGVMSLSQTTGANGGTVSILAPATSSLSATGLVSISTNGSTISIGVPGTTQSGYDPYGFGSKVVGALPGQASLAMQPWQVDVPYQHDRVILPVNYSQATNSTLTVTVSAWFGLYTRNVSTLSTVASTSGTFSINGSGTASSAQNSGLKFLTYAWSNTVTPGHYFLAAVSRTTTAGNNASLSNILINQGLSNSAFSGIMGQAANASDMMRFGVGTFTATTSGIPATIAFTDLRGSGSAAHRVPWVWFISQTV